MTYKITSGYEELSTFPPLAIGVMGSAGGVVQDKVRQTLYQLGQEIGRRGYVLVTGVAPGLPHDSVLGAKSEGGLVIGISPALNLQEHVERYKSPTRGYDLIGLSCYSSYDYLKVMVLAAELKRLLPKAWLVTGGYHASARPADFTGEQSPFDYVIVGDGEAPMVRLVKSLIAGKRPLMRTVGPESLKDPNILDYDWSLLSRYRPVARTA